MKRFLFVIIHFFYCYWRQYESKARERCAEIRGYAMFGKKNVKVYPHVDILDVSFVKVGENVTIHSNVRFQAYLQSPIHISNNVQIYNHSVIQSLGGGIVIGKNVIIGEYTTIQAQSSVIIEDDVLLASKIQIITNTHTYEDISIPIKYQNNVANPVVIKKGAWIGINCTILTGVTIGVNSVVGAGSVVNRDVPDYCIVGGVPARIIKRYNSIKKEWELE